MNMDPRDPGTWPRTKKPPKRVRRDRHHWQDQWSYRGLQHDPDVCDYSESGANLGIKWVSSMGRRPGRCPWCRLSSQRLADDSEGLFPYDIHGTVVWLCCWHCCAQMRKHRAVRARELDTVIAMGHLPAKIPAWYLPPDTLLSLISAAQHHQALRSSSEHPSEQKA